jgi:acetyltransferase
MSPNSELDSLFKASSIAIVGVSQEPRKIGSVMFRNLVEGGYTGKTYLVNPKYQTLYEQPCYPTLQAIPENIDCVCIAVPAPLVKQVLLDAEHKKVAFAVIITAGFGEKGSDGKALEAELVAIAQKAKIRILGPNCLGFMNLTDRINLSFAATSPEKGDVALISQSGAICTAILDIAEKDNLGFSHVISVGNKCDINENALLPYLLSDPATKVIGAYLEDVVHGRELLSLYNEQNNAKPLVVIKPGTSSAGQKAIGSHTGAATSSQSTLVTAFKQRGVVYTDNLEEFYLLLQCFSQCKSMRGERVAIVTNAGGPGILATDAVVGVGLTLAQLSDETKLGLQQALPPESSLQNPIDVLGDAKADRFEQVLTLLSKSSDTDSILVIITPQFVTEIEKTCEVITAISKNSEKTILPVLLGNFIVEQGKQILRATASPYATEIKAAVSVLHKMYAFEQYKKEITVNPPQKAISPIITLQKNEAPTIIGTALTLEFLKQYDIPQVEQLLAIDLQSALNWATTRYPVVLKVPTEIATHKTEVKGVFLNLNTDHELKDAWKKIAQTFDIRSPLLLQRMLNYEEEFFLGATTDASFGKLIVFGKGGIYTKEYNDYGRVILPATREQILRELAPTTIAKIMAGARGKPSLPVGQLVLVIEKFQKLLLENPKIIEIDANPVLITKESVHAVDVKLYGKGS